MDGSRVGGRVGESRNDRHLVSKEFQWLQDRSELEIGAVFFRRPLVHNRAMRKVDERQARQRLRGGFVLGGQSRNHAIQKWQSERGGRRTQESPSGKMLLANDHGRTADELTTRSRGREAQARSDASEFVTF